MFNESRGDFDLFLLVATYIGVAEGIYHNISGLTVFETQSEVDLVPDQSPLSRQDFIALFVSDHYPPVLLFVSWEVTTDHIFMLQLLFSLQNDMHLDLFLAFVP
jgi:hypothetical protein